MGIVAYRGRVHQEYRDAIDDSLTASMRTFFFGGAGQASAQDLGSAVAPRFLERLYWRTQRQAAAKFRTSWV